VTKAHLGLPEGHAYFVKEESTKQQQDLSGAMSVAQALIQRY
jgi:hypothetical protein